MSSSPVSSAPPTGSEARLKGNLGTVGLLFSMLAFQAPLISVAAYQPFVIGYGLGGAAPLMAVCTIFIMLAFAVGLVAMARRMKKPGALYTYITVGLGRITGLGGGVIALVSYLVLGLSNLVVSGVTLAELVHVTLRGPAVPWWACSLVLWALVSTLSLFNIDVSTKVLGVALMLEVAVVVIWDAVVFVNGGPEGRIPDIAGTFHADRLGFALLWGMSAYIGFEAVQVFRSEARDPEKTVPRATYLTIICLGVFYAVASWAYLVAYGTHGAIATADNPLPSFLASLQHYTGYVIRDVANVLMSTSGFALLLASQNIAARYVFTLSDDRVFPHSLSRVNPRRSAPTRAAAGVAVIIVTGLILAVVLGVNASILYTSLAGISIWGILFLIAVTGVAIMVFFRRNRGLERSVWRTLIAPAIGTVGIGVVVVLATIHRADLFGGDATLATMCILILLALGIAACAYGAWLRSHRPDVYERLKDTESPAERVDLLLDDLGYAPGTPGDRA